MAGACARFRCPCEEGHCRDWGCGAYALIPVMLQVAERVSAYSHPGVVEEGLVGCVLKLCSTGTVAEVVRAGGGRLVALTLRSTLVSGQPSLGMALHAACVCVGVVGCGQPLAAKKHLSL